MSTHHADFVVIGAGSAGCVLAHRLSENPDAKVLLLEAGNPDDRPEIHIPLLFSRLLGTDYVWDFYTEPQPHMAGRKMFQPRGRMLGGCSSMNAQIYIRAHRDMYERWAELGNEGWSYDDVLPYFKKSENQERGESHYHGVGGPLNVADQRDTNPLTIAFVEACQELGLEYNHDFNGEKQEGCGYYQVNQKNGSRCSCAVAFLKPIMDRPNLTIKTKAQATRVLFENQRAVGLEYRQDGQFHEVRTDGEIVLAGGAFASPQLLMLSGVGPADDLKALDIPVLEDLPGVGQNLQDHLAGFLNFHCKAPISLDAALPWSPAAPAAKLEYKHFHKGPLSSNLPEGAAFFKTGSELPVPDMQLHFVPGFFGDHGRDLPEGYGMCICPTVLLPKSVGHVKLRSADVADPPILQPNYFQEEDDMEVMLAGAKFCRELAHTQAMADFAGEPWKPGPEVQTDDQLRDYLRETTGTLYHPVGTCKMGVDGDAVVDPQLKVRGFDGLRVADASIMPFIPNGNTHAPSVMIGEKAADMIRAAA